MQQALLRKLPLKGAFNEKAKLIDKNNSLICAMIAKPFIYSRVSEYGI
jgi:hypothetical protein